MGADICAHGTDGLISLNYNSNTGHIPATSMSSFNIFILSVFFLGTNWNFVGGKLAFCGHNLSLEGAKKIAFPGHNLAFEGVKNRHFGYNLAFPGKNLAFYGHNLPTPILEKFAPISNMANI